MSAFIVDVGCMDRVVRGLHLMTPGVFASADFRTSIGRQLFELNVEAVRQRYGRADDMLPEGWQPEDYHYTEPPVLADCPPMVDSLKAIQCLVYQCSEGDVPKRRLYQIVAAVADKLSHAIRGDTGWKGDIEDMPAYQRAKW